MDKVLSVCLNISIKEENKMKMGLVLVVALTLMLGACGIVVDEQLVVKKDNSVDIKLNFAFDSYFTQEAFLEEVGFDTEFLVDRNSTHLVYEIKNYQNNPANRVSVEQSGKLFKTYVFTYTPMSTPEDKFETGGFVSGKTTITMPGNIKGKVEGCTINNNKAICDIYGTERIIKSKCFVLFC